MGVPRLNYSNIAENMLPTFRRLPLFKEVMKAFMSSTSWLNDKFYNYLNGITTDVYNAGTTYSKGAIVYYNLQTYISLVNGNVGNAPDSSPTYWDLYLSTSVGAYDRAKYSPNKLVFELALNRYFGGSFRQPPNTSDIYISGTTVEMHSFIYGADESVSSYYSADGSRDFVAELEAYPTVVTYSFIVNVPVSIYTALGSSANEIITRFVDDLCPAGVTYRIVTY